MLNNWHKIQFFLGMAVLCVSGCSSHRHNDVDHSQAAPHMVVPRDVAIHPAQPSYPIPNVPTPKPGQTTQPSPSLVPPGSDLDRFGRQSMREHSPSSPTTVKVADNHLVLGEDFSIVWSKVGFILHNSPYRILDQDQGLGSYYILDAVSTGNKIVKTTPIYRVYLKKQTGKTEIFVLNQSDQVPREAANQRILSFLEKNLRETDAKS